MPIQRFNRQDHLVGAIHYLDDYGGRTFQMTRDPVNFLTITLAHAILANPSYDNYVLSDEIIDNPTTPPGWPAFILCRTFDGLYGFKNVKSVKIGDGQFNPRIFDTELLLVCCLPFQHIVIQKENPAEPAIATGVFFNFGGKVSTVTKIHGGDGRVRYCGGCGIHCPEVYIPKDPLYRDHCVVLAATRRIQDYVRAFLVRRRFHGKEFREWFYAPQGPGGIKHKLRMGRFLETL